MSVIHRQVMPDLLGKMGNRLCLITNILLRKEKPSLLLCLQSYHDIPIVDISS